MLGYVTLCLHYHYDYSFGYKHPSPMAITSNSFIFKTLIVNTICHLNSIALRSVLQKLKFVFMSELLELKKYSWKISKDTKV